MIKDTRFEADSQWGYAKLMLIMLWLELLLIYLISIVHTYLSYIWCCVIGIATLYIYMGINLDMLKTKYIWIYFWLPCLKNKFILYKRTGRWSLYVWNMVYCWCRPGPSSIFDAWNVGYYLFCRSLKFPIPTSMCCIE